MFLGIEDSGKVKGIPKKASGDMVKNFISVISNLVVFEPTIYLAPEIINYENATLIVMPLDENYSFDMVKSADKVLKNTHKISKSADKVPGKMNKKYIEQQKKILDYITKKEKLQQKKQKLCS